MVDLIALAVPFFFVFIAVELVVSKRRRRAVYRFADAITDLSCGITSQVALVFYGGLHLAMYVWLFDRHRLFTVQPIWLAWVIAFFVVDFVYYWWHRWSHEVNFLWAAHVVHHQSEDYNLAVALRQAIATSWTVLPFYLPLAIFGFPPTVFVTVHALSTLYQFWIHTELVRRIGGPIGFLFNMPAHHRVHHAVNPAYLDKNYGATLIVWDRLFRTYAEEVEPCAYGTTKPLASFDPMWAQFEPWIHLGRMSLAARGMDRLRVFWASPAWMPKTLPAYVAAAPAERRKYDPRISRAGMWYVGVQHGLLVAGTFALLLFHHALSPLVVGLAAAVILSGLFVLGGVLENKPWARPAEVLRVATSAVAVALAIAPLA